MFIPLSVDKCVHECKQSLITMPGLNSICTARAFVSSTKLPVVCTQLLRFLAIFFLNKILAIFLGVEVYYYPFPAVSCKKSVHPIVAQVVPLISEEMKGAAVSLTVKG